MFRLMLVVVGSGVGGGIRYLFGLWALRAFGTGLPYGTLGVNVIGSFLIAVIMHFGLTRGVLSAEVRLLLSTGLMGGLTTYSAFNHEIMSLLDEGAYGLALLYMGATVASCLLAALLATALLRWLA
jgi:CrcB protein